MQDWVFRLGFSPVTRMPNLNAGIISQIESNSSGSQSVPWPKLLMKRNIALSTSVAAIATSGNTKKNTGYFYLHTSIEEKID